MTRKQPFQIQRQFTHCKSAFNHLEGTYFSLLKLIPFHISLTHLCILKNKIPLYIKTTASIGEG